MKSVNGVTNLAMYNLMVRKSVASNCISVS